MRSLTPRPQRRPWVLWAALTGGLLAWVAVLPTPLVQQAASEWLAGDPGASSAALWILVFAVGLLGSSWAIAEA